MLKGFVSGEEKDIKRIPMKGKNLLDESASSDADATHINYNKGTPVVLTAGQAYTFSCNTACNGLYIRSSADDSNLASANNSSTLTYTPQANVSAYFGVWNNNGITNLNPMLNLGSAPLPYEPYGYQEGWEVRDNQDRLIWGREDELQTATGTLPFKGYSLPVKVKSLLGNAVQNGTPAPDNIVTPEMCGVRTRNLCDGVLNVGYFLDAAFRIDTTATKYRSIRLHLESGKYTFSFEHPIRLVRVIVDNTYYENVAENVTEYTITITNDNYDIGISFRDEQTGVQWDNSPIMLNLGSTPLPYEPYGWKVPFENHGENLCPMIFSHTGVVDDNGSTGSYDTRLWSDKIPVSASQSYYVVIDGTASNDEELCFNRIIEYDANGVFISRINVVNLTSTSFTTSANCRYVVVDIRTPTLTVDISVSDINTLMLSLGSTPKPYSPYLNATIPVYLGEVPTVRRVKKLVLDGTEDTWGQTEAINSGFYFDMTGYLRQRGVIIVICSHYVSQDNINGAAEMQDGKISFYANATQPSSRFYIKDSNFVNLADFKSYLSAQYAAGRPVTVWYVTSEPTTTISNEPLCKISTYADELTTIQVNGLSAPLYGIRNYKDTLNLSTGVVTRKVKKLVLTGTETSWEAGTGSLFILSLPDVLNGSGITSCLCSHFSAVPNFEGNYSALPDGCCSVRYNHLKIWFRDIPVGGIDNFKSYLAAQYQAGTPVTIWYILSTPTTETVTVPTGITGEIEGYLTQVSTPTPTNCSVPKWNGVEESGGTYAVAVYTPPEIPTTTGQNTLTVETNLAPSKLEVSIHAKKIHYGFKIDKSNDDSDSAVIYTHDAVTMTPAHMDFTNDRFDYGSWGNAFFVRDCYPVALNLDGTIAYRLDPDDYTKKMDGTPSDIFYELLTAAPSDWSTQWKQYYTKSGDEYILNDQGSAPTFAQDTYYKLTYSSSFTGNFMMAFPKVWFYRHEDSQYNYIEISNYKLSDDWKCYAHINASGQEVDFIYLPLFKGVIVNSKLRSLPGQIPQGNTTATDEVNAATALGSRWQIWDHSSVELINDLLVLMTKSIDSQGRFGKGRESGYNSSDTVTYGKLQTGTLIKGGKFHGFSSSYKEVKVFGIEGFWANRWDRLQGMLLVNNVWKIKMTPPYNFTGTDFVTLSNASVPTGNGYLSKVQTSQYGSIPASIEGGGSSKFYKDYFYKTATDTRVTLRGGSCNSGASCGFRYVPVYNAASNSYWSIGASPVYK